jgi:hypothetical protein
MKARNLLIVAVSLVAVAGIGLYFILDPFGPARRKWTEDVDLGDGRVIQVERMVAFNATNSWSGDAYNAVETESTIEFTGDLSKLPPWSQPLMALVMYQDNQTKEWAVVATTTSCYVWNTHGEPEPMYWEFRLNGEGWREMPLSVASIGRPANLLHRYQSELKTKHIAIADRERLESSPTMGKKFRNVLADHKTNCTKALKR